MCNEEVVACLTSYPGTWLKVSRKKAKILIQDGNYTVLDLKRSAVDLGHWVPV
jgi:hypothetical protein